MKAWLAGHQTTALFLGLAAVFVVSVWLVAARQADDARASRDRAVANWRADVDSCETTNERTAVLLDFILKASADPDPRQFEFITDPVLRQGALDQARRGRADMRARAIDTFQPRNCGAIPAPPSD